tara:strand:+ start:246 stop:425 length:180 start_codon:yes stop_codon:yes gene_type:complete
MAITNYKFNKDSAGQVTGVHPYIDGTLKVGICIPIAEGNSDYREYKKWVDAGNTAEAAD